MDETALRIDKWLWAARFYKTRSLAAQAVDAGEVRVNGAAVKPSRLVHSGDEIVLRKDGLRWVFDVKAIASRRGPAAQAALLYTEHADARAERAAAIAKRRLEAHPAAGHRGRPTKRERRLIHRFTGS